MASDQHDAQENLREAERLLEDLASRAGGFLARVLARAREEAEDIWAEAQSASRSRR